MFKFTLKKVFPGVSWQNPLLNIIFKTIDPIDYVIRLVNGLADLPRYSIRVRSNGITKQFGGQNFARYGNQLAEHLKSYASLTSEAKVLEIGCGCGRTALALSNILEDGKFVGMDIERTSLESCKRHPTFTRKHFCFDYLDVQNNEYNPMGKNRASTYRFPYDDNDFDVIFLVSVFTHMLTDEVENYISEIARMLKPGGTCMLTTFLMDKGQQTNGISFPHNKQKHYFYNNTIPEIAIGYYLDFYKNQFTSCRLRQIHDVLWGSWRNIPEVTSDSGFAQDIIFFTKGKELKTRSV